MIKKIILFFDKKILFGISFHNSLQKKNTFILHPPFCKVAYLKNHEYPHSVRGSQSECSFKVRYLSQLECSYRVLIKYCVFYEDLKIYFKLWSFPGVCMCTRWQVEHQRRSRTGGVQKNHNIFRKNTIFNEHPVFELIRLLELLELF